MAAFSTCGSPPRPPSRGEWGARFVTLASIISALLVTSPAFAQGDAVAGDQAVAFAQEGLKHYEAGAWAEALDRFQKAEARSHSPVFVLYIARAERSLGRLLAARQTYKKLVAEKLPDDAIPSWRQSQADGRAELAALEPTIPSVVVRAEGASTSAVLSVDGKPGAFGQSIELDPGDHGIVIVDGDRRVEAPVTLRPGERAREIVVEVRARVGEDGPGVPPPPGSSDAAGAQGSLVPGIVLLSVGGASLIAGAILGGVALSIDGGITDKCDETGCAPGTDPGQIASDQDTSLALAHASTGTLVGGGVLAAVGVVLLVVRPGGDDRNVSVSVGPTGAAASFRF